MTGKLNVYRVMTLVLAVLPVAGIVTFVSINSLCKKLRSAVVTRPLTARSRDGSKQFRPSGAPIMKVIPEDYDLGTFVVGTADSRPAIFSIRNMGIEPLRIKRIEQLCACEAVRLSASEITAGGTGELTVRIKDPRRSGTASAALNIYSNDPTWPERRLTVHWQVVPPLRFDPAQVKMRRDEEEDAYVGEAIVLSHLTDSLGAQAIEGPAVWPSGLSARLEAMPETNGMPELEGKPIAKVVLKLASKSARESSAGWVKLRLLRLGNVNDLPILPVTWESPSNLQVDPPIAYFGVVRPSVPKTRFVRIRDITGRMFSILGVSTPNEKELFVSPSGTSTHPSAAHELTIELTPPLRVGVYRGAIEIRTDREEEESITVQVCAFVSKPE